MNEPIVPSRRFTAADQAAFARLSGDFNPMHIDPVAARRTQAGDCVVHGVHVLLWALDSLARSGVPLADLSRIEAQFVKFTYLDQPAELQLERRPDGTMRARVVIDAVIVVNLALRFGTPVQVDGDQDWAALPARPIGMTSDELAISDIAGLQGWLDPVAASGECGAAFPDLTAAIGLDRVVGLAQLSTLVGMVCPGLHSIFAALSVELAANAPARAGMGFKVDQLHDELRALRMQVFGSGLRGNVRAFVRWPPVGTASMAELSRQVRPDEFAGTRAFIAGGSRGLGAVTAKLITAGGGDVVATYLKGRTDAEQLAGEINDYGRGTCEIMAFDAAGDVTAQLAPLTTRFSQLYYFATPQIFKQKTQVFSAELLEQFLRFYVYGFFDTCRALSRHAEVPRLDIFYPSSIAVETRPEGMTEYSMAKAAGELLCADLERSDARLRAVISRLPRTLSDQTATVTRVQNADPVEVMLPVVRDMRAP